MSSVPLPQDLPRLTPHLIVKGAAAAIDLYARALGTRELYRTLEPNGGRIIFAELLLQESRIFVVDEMPEQQAFSPATLGGSPVALHLYVHSVDEAFARAVEAGMSPQMPVADYFWGERYGQLKDPFGHVWGFASRTEDLSPAELQARIHDFYKTRRS